MSTSLNDLNELRAIRQRLDGMWQKCVLGGLDSSTGHFENQVLSKPVNKALHPFWTKFGRLHVSSQQRTKECPYIIRDLNSIFSKVCWLWRPRHGIPGWKNGLWVIGQLGQWFPLLRGHSLSFGVLTVAGATPLASWIRDKFSGKTNKQTVVIKKSFKLQKWLKFCLELSAEVSFGRFSDWSRLRLTLP